jgi:trigger factor
VELTPEEVNKHKAKACEEISKEVKIPGFRPGHVPAEVLEKHVDKKYILAHTYELAIQHSYAEIVVKENLQVVSRPKIDLEDSKEKEPFKFKATVAILPEVKVKDHKSIKIPKEEVKISAKEVEETLEDMQKYFMTWQDVEREVKKGDRVELDFEGFEPPTKDAKEPKAIPNTSSKNHPVIVGEGSLVPGFEDNIVGMKKGEKKEFTLTFPADYHSKDFQKKKVLFKVELKRIEEGIKPTFDETLVEKITGKKTKVEDFKKDVESDLKSHKERKAKQDRENKYLEKLIEKTEVEIPDSLIEEEIDYIVEEVKHDIESKGIPFDKFLEKTKMTLEDLRKKYKAEAEKRIKLRLAISHLIKEEKIEVTDAELEEAFKNLPNFKIQAAGGQAPTPTREDKMRLKNNMLISKLFEKLLG